MPELAQPSLFAAIDHKPGVIHVKFIGPAIGQREAPILSDMIAAALVEKPAGLRHLVFDFSRVTFMNSMALGMCVEMRGRAEKLGGKTIIVGLNEELTRLFRMVKFDRLFTIVKGDQELAAVLSR